jgi:hypothetical protein
MLYTLSNVQKKSADWIIADLHGNDGTDAYKVSINRTNRDGSQIQFPNFESFVNGYQIDGNLWTNPADSAKKALYPMRTPAAPKAPATGGTYPSRGGGIAKAQETKKQNIEEAQERKHEAISIAGAFRDATLISLAALKDQPFPTDEEFKTEWTKWVKWILNQHEQPFL